MTTEVLLVRHAMPVISSDHPPELWELSDEGRLAAAALARLLPPRAYLSSSTEPKAWQTLTPMGEARRDPRFNEVNRMGEPFGGNFRELRRSYVDGVDHRGWEPREQVTARFDTAIEEHRALAGAAPLVVATHGMALTLWLTARMGLAGPGEFWAGLRFPHLIRVDLSTNEVTV